LTGIRRIISNWEHSTNEASLIIRTEGSNLVVYASDDGNSINSSNLQHPTNLSTGIWYHIVVAFTSTGDCSVIINGNDVATSTLETVSDFDNWVISSDRDGIVSEYFYGSIEDIRFYDKTLNVEESLNIINTDVAFFTEVAWSIENGDFDHPAGIAMISESRTAATDIRYQFFTRSYRIDLFNEEGHIVSDWAYFERNMQHVDKHVNLQTRSDNTYSKQLWNFGNSGRLPP
jgi:hypothetical protein